MKKYVMGEYVTLEIESRVFTGFITRRYEDGFSYSISLNIDKHPVTINNLPYYLLKGSS